MQRNKALAEFGDGRAVPKVRLHEPLDGPLGDRPLDVPLLGDSQLVVADQNVLTAGCREMQVDADVLEEIVGLQQDACFIAAQSSLQAERVDTGRREACEADPAEKVQVPQPAGRTFDVRFELFDGRAELGPLLFPGGHTIVNEGRDARANDLSLEFCKELLEQAVIAPQEPGFDQRRRDVDLLPRQAQCLGDAADRMAQAESGVPVIAHALGDAVAGDLLRRGADEKQQIDVRIRA